MPKPNNFCTNVPKTSVIWLAGPSSRGAYQPLHPSTMPVTFQIAAHDAEKVRISPEDTKAMGPQEIVTQVWRRDGVKCQGEMHPVSFGTG